MDESPLFQWLMAKPHPKINLILDQLRSNEKVDWSARDIGGAFFWAASPEGPDYWSEVNRWYRIN